MFKLKMYTLIILSVLAAVIGIYGYGRKAGERAVEMNEQRKINKVRQASNEVIRDVNTQSNRDIRAGLRDRWTRK